MCRKFHEQVLSPQASLPCGVIENYAMVFCCLGQFLNYAASNPNGSIVYRKIEMIIQAHADASYLTLPEASSRAGGYIFLGNKDRKPFNGPILVLANIIMNVMGSAAEAEVAALYMIAQELVPARRCLIEMGHPQPAATLKTDNNTAKGIMTGTIKQKRSKAFDMSIYWRKDRVKQGQFLVYWEPGANNLADYPTKHHSATHHKNVRDIYMYNKERSPTTIQGCIDRLNQSKSKSVPQGNGIPKRASSDTDGGSISSGFKRGSQRWIPEGLPRNFERPSTI